jgi:hypothetical protein
MLRELKTFMMFYKVGYEDVLLVVSNGKTTNALEVVIKDYLTVFSTAILSSK